MGLMSSGTRAPRRPADLLVAAMSRRLKLGPAHNKITLTRSVRVPMRDGTILLADHYTPVDAGSRPTVLMRCPYGRGLQFAMLARVFAERGYHVLLQSSRGTFGSGGVFTPAVHEAPDGQDTVVWLREQDWFDGRLATVGASYLAFSAWALALEPPPELFAMAVWISPHDLASVGFGNGAFQLSSLLGWSDLMAGQERYGLARMVWRTFTTDRRLMPMMNRLPLTATGTEISKDGAPWYGEWLTHPDRADPYWTGYSAAAALDQVTVPTLLISGFHDFFAEQTMQQYQALQKRDVPIGLTIGPWTHVALDMGVAARETLAWLDAYSDGDGKARPYPVRAWVSGLDQWREGPDWPPADVAHRTWYLRGAGGLGTDPDDGDADTFRYDPADPAPAVGGRTLSASNAGSKDNTAVEARDDVLTFSTEPLERPLEVAGVPEVRLFISSDNVHHDLFARLCDVDEHGTSHNLTDQLVRADPGEVIAGELREISIALTDVSHVFLAGHRIRLQLTGGAHPRFARNLGTDADQITSKATAPVTHQILHGTEHPSALTLPVVAEDPPAKGTGDTPRPLVGHRCYTGALPRLAAGHQLARPSAIASRFLHVERIDLPRGMDRLSEEVGACPTRHLAWPVRSSAGRGNTGCAGRAGFCAARRSASSASWSWRFVAGWRSRLARR
jgi:putative CocE/NonD family hydrolase